MSLFRKILYILTLCLTISINAYSEEIKIGAILHLTGDLAMQGQAFREGIELAENQINTDPNWDNLKIKVIYEDSHFEQSKSHAAAKKLIEVDHVFASLITTFHESKSAAPLFEKANIPLISLWDSTPELDSMGEYIFSIGSWLPSTGEVTAKFAYQQLKAKKAALITENSNWSVDVTDDFKNNFEELGGKVVSSQNFNPGDNDFKVLLLKAKRSNPDVLYAPNQSNMVTFFKQAKQLDVNFPIIQSDNINQAVIDALGDKIEGVYQSHSMDPSHEEAIKLEEQYKKYFKKDPKLLLMTAWGYDGIMLIANSVKKGAKNGEDLKKALYKVNNYPGTSGKINITKEGSNRVPVNMFQVKNGSFKYIS